MLRATSTHSHVVHASQFINRALLNAWPNGRIVSHIVMTSDMVGHRCNRICVQCGIPTRVTGTRLTFYVNGLRTDREQRTERVLPLLSRDGAAARIGKALSCNALRGSQTSYDCSFGSRQPQLSNGSCRCKCIRNADRRREGGGTQ